MFGKNDRCMCRKVGRVMYYHGTTKDNADIIVKSQFMQPSVGDDQWLGEGYYFYYDVEYAFRWILIKYTNNFKNEFSNNYDNIYEEYSILSAKINIDPERLFDLDNIHHKLLFISVKTELSKKTEQSEKYHNRIKNNAIVDGVVFNYLFKYMKYEEKYDAVRAVFPISYIFDDSRMDYLPEPQLCVKNITVISDYEKFSTDQVPEEYKKFIVDYYQAKRCLKQKKDFAKYKIKPKSIKYKKEGLVSYDRNRKN